MKIEKIYGVGSNILVSFTQASVSDSVRVERLREENADVFVGEKMTEMPWLFVPSRCNGKQLALDASVITGGTLDTIQIGKVMPEPKKIIRSGEYTTVLWKDGTKTIVKRMPGSEDSDYAAFTAALAKKVYGTNSKVERIVAKTERVKTKAEKKATRKLKRKYEEKITGEKKYIVSQYGEISECNNLDGLVKTIIYAESKEDARKKAYSYFARSMNVYVVQSNGNAYVDGAYLADDFGKWCTSIGFKDVFWTPVFALSKEEALKVLTINPAPKEGDKP